MAKVAGEGVPLLYLTIVFLILSWVTFVTRVGVRRWIDAFGSDDWLMGGGLNPRTTRQILYTVTASLVIVCCFYGAGQHSDALSKADIQTGTKLFFIAEFFYAACTVLIKCSISVTLLRIADARRRFVWTLRALMGLTSIAAIVFILAIANICHPITMLWGETTEGSCNPSLNSSVSFFFSAVSIVTDLVLATLPGILMWRVNMKKTVKFSVVVILGLAAFASCATVVRLRYLTLYNDQKEFMFSTGAIGLWSILEEGIGIVAGSLPALRPLLTLPILGGNSRETGNSSSAHGTTNRILPTATPPSFQSSSKAQQQKQQGGPLRPQIHPRGASNAFRLSVFDCSPASESILNNGDNNNNYNQRMANWGRRSPRGSGKDAASDDEDDDNDGDSQKQIVKEVHVSVEAEDSNQSASDDWIRQQVLGWDTDRRSSRAGPVLQ
ncbi:hypothetical protein PG990_014098 [Apiospora arundinis]